ncbi:LytR/AlgR family response regulator transcription factor [Rubrivirga sp.]|uniref:LytR/AlgR family response regulator transcription factor n=1 Tax=Rubrivirga sp. TaxID=1885344 RepID=UPI003B520F93
MSARLRAVVVDDERLARVELRRLLAAHPEVEVVGEATSAAAARDLLDDLAQAGTPPDVLFLDVQMPRETGFDLLAGLGRAPSAVVFVTAYDDHAIRAFEVSALDYLVKPVSPARLAQTLERVASAPPPAPPPADAGPLLGEADRVFVKDGERLHFVRLGDVRLFESEGNYVRLYHGAERPLVLRSLSALEGRLDPAAFFRASRKHVVNLAHVVGVEPWFKGGLRLVLEAGEAVELSRRQAQRFRDQTGL